MKKSKKIVIVSRAIAPLQSPRANRTTELAKELARQGHSVKVYAVLGAYDYTEFEQEHKMTVSNIPMVFADVNSDGPLKKSIFYRGFKRLFGKMFEFPDIEFLFKVPNCLRKEKDVDLLITIAIPHSIHWGTALYRWLRMASFPKVWIADCGDPYMGNEILKPFFYFSFLERWFCRSANFITVPIREAKRAYYPEFQSKIKVIPQGFNFEEVSYQSGLPENRIVTFIYAGYFYKDSRDPRPFLDYLCTISIPFRFIVYTKSRLLLEDYRPVLGDKLTVRDYVPRKELVLELSKADFLVNFENSSSTQSPSKLIDYALSNRPILSIRSDKLDVNIIEKFLMGDYSNRLLVPDIQQYNIINVAAKFLSLADSLKNEG